MQNSLEEKQAYLRENIQSDHYEDFYEFCDREVGSVDIYTWTLQDVANIVRRFNEHMSQERQKQDVNPHECSYYDYQSAPCKEDDENNPDKVAQNITDEEPSECATSRVVKSSAVDLLDEVFENTTTKSHYQASSNSKNNNSSSVSFDDFEFWTSTLSPSQQEKTKQTKKDGQVRLKSATQYEPKIYSPKYNPKETQNRMRNSSQVNNSVGNEFDAPSMRPKEEVPAKKTSPYLKKQKMPEPSQAKRQINLISVEPMTVVEGKKVEKWLVEQKVFNEVINCYKSTVRNQLADRSMNIFIDKHSIIQRSFLSSDYPMYELKISPQGLHCNRNYEDFTKLKQNLQKFFPGHHLPYLDESSWFSGTNEDFINNQKKMLQFFLRDLIRNKELRNSRVLEEFLMIKDHKPMKRKFQTYQKMQILKGIEELCLLQGKVQMTINNEQKNYNENMKNFIQKMDSYFQKFTRLSENVSKSYYDLMSTYKSLSSLSLEMEKQVKNFNTKVTTNEIKKLGSVFRILRETHKEDYSNANFQHQIYTKKLLPFIKYEHNNFKELNKLIETNQKFERHFEKRSNHQTIKLNDQYNSEDHKQTKRGVLNESKSLLVLKYQTGYIGRQVRVESQRVFDELGVKIYKRWQLLGSCYLDKLLKNVDYWKTLAKMEENKFDTELTY